MKILLFCPALHLSGGVANFIRMLKPYLDEDVVLFQKRQGNNIVTKLLFLLLDLSQFSLKLLTGKYDIVWQNPSLVKNAVARDMCYAFIAKRIFRKKLVIFWHGWNEDYQNNLTQKDLNKFKKTFFHAEKMFVLASEFGKKLREWGYQGKIIQATTCFEDQLLEKSPDVKKESDCINLLFLARIEKEKGIFTALDMMEILQNSPRNYHLCVAGSGSALEEAKLYAARKNLCNVEFAGYLTGDRKKEILQQADVYVSPTTHGEGLPCALLEAMGTGQLIVTRSVGGIKDFFEQNRMGFATESFSPQVFAEAIENLCSDRQKMDAISQYNRAYAAEHFCASKTAEKIQNMVKAE